MKQNGLRIYHGPDDGDRPPVARAVVPAPSVQMPLGEILPLLADAHLNQRAWIHDFGGDTITVSADLYEVLLAYQRYQRSSA